MIAGCLRLLENVGNWLLYWVGASYGVVHLIGTCLAWIIGGPLFGRPIRLSTISLHIFELGLKSLPVTILFAFSFGLVTALQVTVFQQSIDYLPPILRIVGNFVARDQAPAFVGILLAARAGGAITSEISTMVFDREVLALRSMGIDPLRFVVAPALVAMAVATPILSLVMTAVQIVTLALYLFFAKGIAPIFVIDLAVEGISGTDLMLNATKSVIFGLVVLGISARSGLTVVESGRSTGSATTFAVVASIVAVLLINALMSILGPE